jgi:glycosyltransferase involved in cell wall biosynthesis
VRIVIISNLYPPASLGGYELAAHDVAEGLRARGHYVKVLTSRRPTGLGRTQTAVPNDTAADASDVFRVLRTSFATATLQDQAKSAIWSIWNYGVARAEVLRSRPDVVLCFNLWGLGSLVALRGYGRARVVHDISDEHLVGARSTDPWAFVATRDARSVRRRLLRPLARVLIGSTPVDISRSYFRSDYLRSKFRPTFPAAADCPVIHHGVEVGPIGEAVSPPIVCIAGRLAPNKGTHILISALAKIPHELQDRFRVIIAGPAESDPYLKSLKVMVEDVRAEVRFAGHVSREEVAKLLRRSAVFVHPATWPEPFSIAILEAMAAGCAVVATSTGGTPEQIEQDHTGILVAPNDAAALAAALTQLLNDPALAKRLGTMARTAVERHFSLERAIAAIDAHLRSVVEEW